VAETVLAPGSVCEPDVDAVFRAPSVLPPDFISATLTLEYKASPALTRDSKIALELCKDVSAMANSAGGPNHLRHRGGQEDPQAYEC
jgi:hypothetical protein